MKSILLKLDDKSFDGTALEEQIVREVQLLNQLDPHKELNEEFEVTCLNDLKRNLDE